jgi:hypothetical protein
MFADAMVGFDRRAMTIVLSYATPTFTLQVSDRLVTEQSSREPLDPSANKAVIFLAKNALVSAAYCGRAVIGTGSDERPTDHWLAEQLAGQPLGTGWQGGIVPYEYDLGYALRAVCNGLDRLAAGAPIEVALCGLQWSARPDSPALAMTGSIRRENGRYTAKQSVLRLGQPLKLSLNAIPDVAALNGQTLVNALGEVGNDPDAAEAMLVEALQTAANDSKVIGRNCTATMLCFGANRIRFHGDRPEMGHEGVVQIPSTPTPWIVTPGLVMSPARVNAPVTVGSLTMRIDSPPLDVPFTEPSPGRRRYLVPVMQTEPRKWGPKPPNSPPPPMSDDPPDAPPTPPEKS